MAYLGPKPAWGHYYESQRQKLNLSFDLFPDLPPELRIMIWEMAFPALTVPSRVFSFRLSCTHKGPEYCFNSDDDDQLMPYDERQAESHYSLLDGERLRAETLPTRQLNAINRETRTLLLKALPDTIEFEFQGDLDQPKSGTLHFRKSTDIIYLTSPPIDQELRGRADLTAFSSNVCNVGWSIDPVEDEDGAFDPDYLEYRVRLWQIWLSSLPFLKTFYFGAEHNRIGCPQLYKGLLNETTCVQYGVYRFPSQEIFAEYKPSSTTRDSIIHSLRLVADSLGWNMIPILRMNVGMYSAILDEGCGGAQ